MVVLKSLYGEPLYTTTTTIGIDRSKKITSEKKKEKKERRMKARES